MAMTSVDAHFPSIFPGSEGSEAEAEGDKEVAGKVWIYWSEENCLFWEVRPKVGPKTQWMNHLGFKCQSPNFTNFIATQIVAARGNSPQRISAVTIFWGGKPKNGCKESKESQGQGQGALPPWAGQLSSLGPRLLPRPKFGSRWKSRPWTKVTRTKQTMSFYGFVDPCWCLFWSIYHIFVVIQVQVVLASPGPKCQLFFLPLVRR